MTTQQEEPGPELKGSLVAAITDSVFSVGHGAYWSASAEDGREPSWPVCTQAQMTESATHATVTSPVTGPVRGLANIPSCIRTFSLFPSLDLLCQCFSV